MKTAKNCNDDEIVKEKDQSKPETFESLTEKHNILSAQISKLQQRIDAAKQSMEDMKAKTDTSQDEDLDAYMAVLER